MGNGKAFTPGLQLFHRVLEGVKINYQSQIILGADISKRRQEANIASNSKPILK